MAILSLAAPAGAAIPLMAQAVDPATDEKEAAGVYVRDSGAARDELTLGQKMERLGEWAKAADIFQEIQEKYPDRVIACEAEKDNVIRLYTSVQAVVQQDLCSWPKAGQDVYRARFGAKAQGILDQAGRNDLASLNLVYGRYFITEAGRKAGILLQNTYIERGEFAAAAVVGKQLLEHHPNMAVDRAAVLYRTVQALHLAGNDSDADGKKYVAELQGKFATITARVRGTDTVLADSLAQVLAVAAPARAMASGDSYRTLGGDESRSLIPTGAAQPGAKLYSISYAATSVAAGVNPQMLNQVQQMRQRQLEQGSMLGVIPAIDQGQLFFQDNVRLYAVDLDSGYPLPGWASTYPGSDKFAGTYSIGGNGSSMPPNQQMTVTVTDASVLAVMGEPDSNAAALGQAQPGSRLVCLDRRTGKLRWAIAPAGLPGNTSQPLQSLQFGGAPLVVSDNVYIVGGGGKGAQFKDCYVLCFDLSSGAFKWATYIASSDAVTSAYGAMPQSTNMASLAYSDGRIFVSTNAGAAAAVDAFDGSIAWLRIYRDAMDTPAMSNNPMVIMGGGIMIRGGVIMNGMVVQTGDLPKPFYTNPAVVRDGCLFICPMDSRCIFVYSVDDGRELARIDRKTLHSAIGGTAAVGGSPGAGSYSVGGNSVELAVDPAVLIGVSGDTLYLGFNGIVAAVDWRLLQAGKKKGDWLTWAESVNGGLHGRPMVTDSFMYVPQPTFLGSYKVRNGYMMPQYPQDGSWTATRGPGNVLVSGNHVVIASETSVDVYTDLEAVERTLNQSLAAAPADPEPRLQYAETLFAAGHTDQATQKLDEAIGLMGGTVGLRSGPSRERLFNDAMIFAQRSIEKSKDSTSGNSLTELIIAYYDRAGQAAASPAQMVRYRLQRADWESSTGNYAGAISLYQDILADPALGAVTVVTPQDRDGSGSVVNQAASTVAGAGIKDILAKGGSRASDAYARFETAAQQRMDQAGNDPAALLAVAQVYPNSKVALSAMFAAADQFEAAGDPVQAGRILRRIETTPHPDSMQPRLLESMARDAFAVPNRIDIGVARLNLAASSFGGAKITKPIKLPSGAVLSDVTFKQAYDAAQKYSGELSQASLPDMNIPSAQEVAKLRAANKAIAPFLPPDPAAAIDDVMALVQPLASFGRNDRIAVWSAESKMRVFAVGATVPALTLPLNQTPHNLAYMGERLCAWSDSEVASARWDHGQSPWQFALTGLPQPAVLAPAQSVTVAPAVNPNPPNQPAGQMPDPEDVTDPFLQQALQRAMVIRGLAQAAPPAVAAAPAGISGGETIIHVRPLSDRLILATSTGRVFALAISDGRLLWQSRVGEMPILQLVASDDFVVLRSADDSNAALDVLDADSGQKLAEQKYANQQMDMNANQAMIFNGVAMVAAGGAFPINMALAGDGTLVWMMPNQLCIQDLYHPNLAQPKATTPLDASRQPIFANSIGSDQLIIAAGRIMAVSDGGKIVRLYALQTGEVIGTTLPTTPPNSMPVGPGGQVQPQAAGHVGLLVAGTYMYAVGPEGVIAYNLDSLGNRWVSSSVPKPAIARTIIDKNYLLAMCGVGSPMTINSWSRAIITTKAGATIESGVAGAFGQSTLSDTAGISDMQAVDGGLYYMTADHKLKLVRGAHQP